MICLIYLIFEEHLILIPYSLIWNGETSFVFCDHVYTKRTFSFASILKFSRSFNPCQSYVSISIKCRKGILAWNGWKNHLLTALKFTVFEIFWSFNIQALVDMWWDFFTFFCSFVILCFCTFFKLLEIAHLTIKI